MKSIINPTVNIIGSTKYIFPSGYIGRKILAHKYLDALYVMSIRIGSDMTKKYLLETSLQHFFLIFEDICSEKLTTEKVSNFLFEVIQIHILSFCC